MVDTHSLSLSLLSYLSSFLAALVSRGKGVKTDRQREREREEGNEGVETEREGEKRG